MPRLRRFLLLGLLAVSSVWLATVTVRPAARQLVLPDVRSTVRSIYEEPSLADYRAAEQLTWRGDLDGLGALVQSAAPGFLRYRTLLTLARDPRVPIERRAEFYEQLLAEGLLEPLARNDVRRAYLEVAEVTAAAGQRQRAVEAYLRAFPLPEALSGVTRLEPRPLERAQLFLQVGAYPQALAALESSPQPLGDPLLEARIYRGLGDVDAALSAYDRLLARVGAHPEAQAERAWLLLARSRASSAPAHLDEAAQAFTALTGATRSLGLGMVAAERGDHAEAAAHYVQYARESANPEGLWRATEMLEEGGDTETALGYYLELARQPSSDGAYQSDAAYRALVLAERLGDAARAEEAAALLSDTSYFGVLRRGFLAVPGSIPEPVPGTAASREGATPGARRATELAAALERAGDREAAQGELLFALERAEDEATTVALAGALQASGEFRRSAQAAGRYLEAGSRDRDTWEAAYPRAYRAEVEASAARWNVDPALVWAVMRQESGFYPRAVSTSEAKGLMQVIPSTWSWLAELLGEPAADPFGVADNIRYGTFYLGRLEREFGGDLERTVAAYNGGPGYVGGVYSSERVAGDQDAFYRFIDRDETREYLQKVMYNHAAYRTLYPGMGGEVADAAGGAGAR